MLFRETLLPSFLKYTERLVGNQRITGIWDMGAVSAFIKLNTRLTRYVYTYIYIYIYIHICIQAYLNKRDNDRNFIIERRREKLQYLCGCRAPNSG